MTDKGMLKRKYAQNVYGPLHERTLRNGVIKKLIEVFMPDNTFVRRRYFSCLPPVVSRLQVADYELLIHVTNVVSKEDIKVAVSVCIIK
jgi:hypothetical protein